MLSLSIYGDDLTEERRNKITRFILGKKKCNKQEVYRSWVMEFFGITIDRKVGIWYTFQGTNDLPMMVNIYSNSIEFGVFREEEMTLVRNFVQRYFRGQTIGLKFPYDCEQFLKNGKTVSIKVEENEVFQDLFDNLEDIHVIVL